MATKVLIYIFFFVAAGVLCYQLVPVVWDKIDFWVAQKDYMLLQEEYFDEKGRKVRTLYFEDVKKLDGREIPTKWVLQPHLENEDNQTVLEILAVDFDVKIPDRIFTRQHLERSR